MHKGVQAISAAAALQHIPDVSAELLQLGEVGSSRPDAINLAARGYKSQHACISHFLLNRNHLHKSQSITVWERR